MKKEWVKYICDPVDRTDLAISSIEEMDGNYIVSGMLVSENGKKYRIKNGVPILITDKSQTISSVESFGFEWNKFAFSLAKEGWLKDVVYPIVGDSSFFKDKVIVDAGAGSGVQSCWIAEAGAKFVFSLELSDSATSAVLETTRSYKDRIFVIQTDISNPPINTKNITIDAVYCVNVIQHTEDPRRATASLSSLLERGGYFIYNIYMERGRGLLIKMLDCIRKIISKLPYGVVKFFCLVLACLIYPISAISLMRPSIKKYLPTGHSFKETWLNIYDILGAHEYQKFYTRKEVEDIIKNADCVIAKESYYGFLLRKN